MHSVTARRLMSSWEARAGTLDFSHSHALALQPRWMCCLLYCVKCTAAPMPWGLFQLELPPCPCFCLLLG